MEVCVDSAKSAINAQNGGASRIELCANLAEGGTTPSIGLLKVVKKRVSIPVFIMIRPRSGDFCYNNMEMSVMKEDIRLLKQQGADGFVFGVLKTNGSVDKEKCQELLDEVHPLPATFHRAIDMCQDIMEAMSVIVDLGFQRVLSSGGCFSALEGASLLTKMIEKYGSEIIIMPGGGINVGNLEMLLKCGATEFHGSASDLTQSLMVFRHPFLYLGSTKDNEYLVRETSSDKVQALVKTSQNVWNKVG